MGQVNFPIPFDRIGLRLSTFTNGSNAQVVSLASFDANLSFEVQPLSKKTNKKIRQLNLPTAFEGFIIHLVEQVV